MARTTLEQDIRSITSDGTDAHAYKRGIAKRHGVDVSVVEEMIERVGKPARVRDPHVEALYRAVDMRHGRGMVDPLDTEGS